MTGFPDPYSAINAVFSPARSALMENPACFNTCCSNSEDLYSWNLGSANSQILLLISA